MTKFFLVTGVFALIWGLVLAYLALREEQRVNDVLRDQLSYAQRQMGYVQASFDRVVALGKTASPDTITQAIDRFVLQAFRDGQNGLHVPSVSVLSGVADTEQMLAALNERALRGDKVLNLMRQAKHTSRSSSSPRTPSSPLAPNETF
jgi:hypothetical protein